MKWIKYAIVRGLVGLCTILDCLPGYEQGRWWTYGDWGCRTLKLARWSSRLEDRWHTGAWESAPFSHRSLYDNVPIEDPGQHPHQETGQG